MPADFMRCVDSLLNQGKSKDSAYAICTVQYKKKHKGRTPQQDEESAIDLTPTQDEIEALAFMYEEIKELEKKG